MDRRIMAAGGLLLAESFMPGTAAASAPSFDCKTAASDAEALVCGDAGLAAIDRRLADRFNAAIDEARGLDANADATIEILRAEQHGWRKSRDDCWKASDPRGCVTDAYLRREAELVGSWFLEEPIMEMAYYCGGNYADEVVAMVFDTELPAARIEYGEVIDVATLVHTMSGSRYDGTFGRWIWIKGDEATFVWSDGDEQHCESAE